MIVYSFKFADGRARTFATAIDAAAPLSSPRTKAPAFWTALSFGQCAGCPLAAADHPHCPAALALEEIATAFADLLSFEMVDVEVQTPERTVVKRTDIQSALRSLMGLKMAACGCPILGRLRGLARLHLPFASFEETLVRVTGAYLLRQYIVAGSGGTPDWTLGGLGQLFAELERINICLKRRFDALDQKDAHLNAIVAFLAFSARAAMSLEEKLADLAPYAVGGEFLPAPAPGEAAIRSPGTLQPASAMPAPAWDPAAALGRMRAFPGVRRKVKQRA